MIGNLGDLAELGIASEPTLTAWIKSEPDQPWILRRGSKGVDYEIDLEGAVQAWRAKEDAKTQAAKQKSDALRQFGLDLGLNGCEDDQAGISIQERNLLLEEEMNLIKLMKLRGELILKSDVLAAASQEINLNRNSWESLPAELALKLDLSRDQIQIIENMVATRLHRHASEMEKLGQSDGDFVSSSTAAIQNTAFH